MTIRDYLLVLRRRWRVTAACVVLALLAAAVVNFVILSKQYTASAQIVVTSGEQQPGSALLTGLGGSRATSYAEIADNENVAADAVRIGNLDIAPSTLKKRVSAEVPAQTSVINLKVSDPTPEGARRAADAVAEALSAKISELETPQGGRKPALSGRVAGPAIEPTKPSSPSTVRNLAFGLIAGLAIGIGLAIMIEIFDTRVRTVSALSDRLGLVPLGVMEDDPAVKGSPLIVKSSPHSGLAESFRQLRTNLQFVEAQAENKVMAVTSAQPGEGKSTVACNLALALAQAGESVILVEGDFRRPKIRRYLGIGGGPGLSEVLIGRASVDEALQPWGEGRLRVLIEGAIPPNPSELLGSQAMVSLLASLKVRASIVLIDTPPLLYFADAAVAARLADTTLLVVRAGETRLERVGRALGTLETVGAQVCGAVLNMVPTRGPDADYDGYRGYYGRAYYTSTPAGNGAAAPQTPVEHPASRNL